MSKSLIKTLLIPFICIVVVVGLLLSVRSCARPFDFLVGGSENIKLLNELNESWQLGDDYVIEQVENSLPMEWLHQKEKTSSFAILQLHGGAYIRSLNYRPNLYQRMAEQYAIQAQVAVLTVDYRIAPEYTYPAALEDAVIGYQYLLNKGYSSKQIIIAGDSAGGGLALALTMYLRDHAMPLPLGIITMSAWTNLDYRRKVAYVGSNDARDPYISPLYGTFAGFPPLLMQVGTRDIKNDTIKVAEKAQDAGANITVSVYQGMPHVFQALFPVKEEANSAWREVADFVKQIKGGNQNEKII